MIHGKSVTATEMTTDELAEHSVLSTLATSIIDGPDPGVLYQRGEFMTPYRDRLIADETLARIRKDPTVALDFRMKQLQEFPPTNLTDPVADPLGVIDGFISERAMPKGNLTSDGLYLQSRVKENAHFIFIELSETAITSDAMIRSIEQLRKLANDTAEDFNVEISMSGVPLHSTQIKKQTSEEIFFMTTVAIVITTILFLLAISSIPALIISLLTLGVALVAGLLLAEIITGLPHLIGLIMASTAIGICIDFSLHYWMHRRDQHHFDSTRPELAESESTGPMPIGFGSERSGRQLSRGMTMSMLTTLLGFSVMAFMAIPVLSQSAVVIVGALVTNWAFAMWVYPRFNFRQSSLSWSFMENIPPQAIRLVLTAILVAACIGIGFFGHVDDRAQRLRQVLVDQYQEDQLINQALGLDMFQPGFIIHGKNDQSLLEREEQLLATLDTEQLKQTQAISRLIPSIQTQNHNYRILKESFDVFGQLPSELIENTLGFTPDPVFSDGLENFPLNHYELASVVQQPWALSERDLLLYCDGEPGCASVIRTSPEVYPLMSSLCQEADYCSEFSLSDHQTRIFSTFRENLIFALFVVLATMLVVLWIRYRTHALKIMLVPLVAILVGVASVSWFGFPITAFSVASLFPLTGLSIDYAIFTAEVKDRARATSGAIFISALTTTFSFTILSFSQTPAVQFFAIPVACGIPAAWLLVWLLKDEIRGS